MDIDGKKDKSVISKFTADGFGWTPDSKVFAFGLRMVIGLWGIGNFHPTIVGSIDRAGTRSNSPSLVRDVVVPSASFASRYSSLVSGALIASIGRSRAAWTAGYRVATPAISRLGDSARS